MKLATLLLAISVAICTVLIASTYASFYVAPASIVLGDLASVKVKDLSTINIPVRSCESLTIEYAINVTTYFDGVKVRYVLAVDNGDLLKSLQVVIRDNANPDVVYAILTLEKPEMDVVYDVAGTYSQDVVIYICGDDVAGNVNIQVAAQPVEAVS